MKLDLSTITDPKDLPQRNVVWGFHTHQPNREEPESGRIRKQPEARPYPDFSARVVRECYYPCARAGIRTPDGMEQGLINIFGEAAIAVSDRLLGYLQAKYPLVYASYVAGHHHNMNELGISNMMAECFDHAIPTLLTPRERRRQLRWGKIAFKHRLGVDPLGFWAAEGCISLDVLTDAYDLGFRYTVVRPYQVQSWSADDGKTWTDAPVAPWQPLRVWMEERQDWFTLFVYDSEISQEMAFRELLGDGNNAFNRIRNGYRNAPDAEWWARFGPQIILTFMDLETLGHHKHEAEMGAAYAMKRCRDSEDVNLSNLSALYQMFERLWQMETPWVRAILKGVSSWSCAHGDKRWKEHCGCTEGGPGRSQDWRRYLKASTDLACSSAWDAYKLHGPQLFNINVPASIADPDERDMLTTQRLEEVEDGYLVTVLLAGSTNAAWDRFLTGHARPGLSPVQRRNAKRLMRILEWAALSKTSCGWFFDELSRPEGVQNLRSARFAVRNLLAFGIDREADFLAELAGAPSNVPMFQTGKGVWEQRVLNPPEGGSALVGEMNNLLAELLELPEQWLVDRLAYVLSEMKRLTMHVDLWDVHHRVLESYVAAQDLELVEATDDCQLHRSYLKLATLLNFNPALLGWRP